MVTKLSGHTELGCVRVWVDMDDGVPPAVVWPGSAWGLQPQITACTLITLVHQQPIRFEPADYGTNVANRLLGTCYTLDVDFPWFLSALRPS